MDHKDKDLAAIMPSERITPRQAVAAVGNLLAETIARAEAAEADARKMREALEQSRGDLRAIGDLPDVDADCRSHMARDAIRQIDAALKETNHD